MDKVIVTIRNEGGTISADMELPTEVKMEIIKEDILEVLSESGMPIREDPDGLVLRSYRLNRELRDKETLHYAGVRNGDTLILTRWR